MVLAWEMAKATFRLYKAAILCVLRGIAGRPGRDTPRIQSAIDLLAAEQSTGGRRKGTKTSSLKSRSFPPDDVERMLRYLKEANLRSRWAEPTILAIHVLLLTGVRPSELASLRVVSSAPGYAFVTFGNAKTSNGRGNGETRSIELRDLTDMQLNALACWPEVLAHHAGQYTPAAAIRRIALYFRDVARRTLGKRRHYPSLYSLRHQFAANAKASGLSCEEIAALMGHASNVTATRHYGRRARGTQGVKARPLPTEVSRVRQKAKPFNRRSAPNA